ncbi:LysR family transcriptional regulator [Pararobbsia silviterrae]|uniref:LysR family transcriptional regulator n=1 Tax=Pararobbsia silviterrae TaxID=1792498 RepID=UPI001409DACE|nr:LysR family transcriptional regulator [Pararobbsia silviterrae]
MDRLIAAKVFVEVVDRGSLTAASQALDMSRAMVSRYLNEMEAWVGARLLHRTTRRLSLTDAGNETLPRCRKMLDVAGEMRCALDDDAVPRGALRLTCSMSIGHAYLAPLLVRYVEQYPGTSIDMLLVDRLVNLVEERVDLAIRVTNDLDPALIARPLGHCPSIVCASPAYLERYGTPTRAEDLSGHNCLTYTYFSKSFWRFAPRDRAAGEQREREGLRSRGEAGDSRDGADGTDGADSTDSTIAVPVTGNLSANEVTVLREAAVAGAGITMQPAYAVQQLVREGKLVALLPDLRPDEMTIYAVYASRKHMPAILRTLIDFLAERFAEDPIWGAATRTGI